ncbi:MAG TPA: transcriptional regulator [Desulfobulbaceae bacterium]|nr:transcriptional regulator [Desulfobulbaceae bacterium]
MDSVEFAEIRKKLDKTQREIATLLGISLKAVCSYEQGWRTIPAHVERQIIFLLSRKSHRDREIVNCWDLRNCPEEKKERCPAWEYDAGEFCWFINGTICESATCKNWETKILVCKNCVVMKSIK